MHSNQSRKSILFVLSHSPAHSLGRDCWDAVMTAALLDQPVNVLLTGDGVYQIAEPEPAARIDSLRDLGSVHLFAVRQDLEARQVNARGLESTVKLLGPTQLTDLFRHNHQVLSF